MEGKYSVISVAKWFLTKKNGMTLKKLQKLCYYAQAWFYTLKDVKLADTKFEAWKHGPVSIELWNELKDLYRTKGCMYEFNINDLPEHSNIEDVDDIELLEMVWNTYSDQSGTALEALSHSEDPWKFARGNCRSEDKCRNEITLESMKKYYSTIYNGSYGE